MDNQWEVVDNQWEVATPPVAQPKKRLSAGEVATGALQNIIPSTGRLVKETVGAVVHPIDTISNVLDVGVGEMRKVLPQSVVKAIDKADVALGYKEGYGKQEKMANALNNMYKERYGSAEGFKEALANDPASVLADVSTVVGGGSALTKGSKLGKVLQKGSEVTNPLTLAEKVITAPIKGASELAKGTMGITTGAGKEAVNQAIKAGETSNQTFLKNLRRGGDMEEVVNIAKSGLENMRQEKNNAYRSGMVDISKDQSILNFDDIDKSLNNAIGRTQYKGQVIKQGANKKIDEATKLINKWRNLDPAEYHTPEGMDALKQQIGDILEDIPYEQKNARGAVGDVYNAIKETIKNQAPTYSDVMKNYSDASEQINEIKRALSLGEKSSADTALKKLQSVLRDDVSSSFGYRKQLADQLVQSGAEDLMPALAGQALSTWKPRGMLGNLETAGGAYYALTHPASLGSALAAAPFVMPRSVGEMAYAYGKGKGAVKNLGKKSPVSKSQAKKLGLLLEQANQGNQGEE